jgi:type IV fimbrial biogenesis protein FimT
MKITPKSKNTGFTLIELIVTVTIVAIFASIALPSFSQLIKSNRITVATNEFVSTTMFVRSEALKRSRDVSVCTTANQTSCSGGTDFSTGWIVYADCDGSGNLTAGDVDCNNDGTVSSGEREIIKVHEGFNNIYIGGADEVTYELSGRIAQPALTLNVGNDASDLIKDIVISRVGRVRTEDH